MTVLQKVVFLSFRNLNVDQISLVSDLFLAATRNARADVLLLQSSEQVVDLALPRLRTATPTVWDEI